MSDKVLGERGLEAALVSMATNGLPADMQELMVHGNPTMGVKPNLLHDAIRAYLSASRPVTQEAVVWRTDEPPANRTVWLFGSYIYPGDRSPTEYFDVGAWVPEEAVWIASEGRHAREWFSHWAEQTGPGTPAAPSPAPSSGELVNDLRGAAAIFDVIASGQKTMNPAIAADMSVRFGRAAAQLAALAKERDEQSKRILELLPEVYIPGEFQCKKCGFALSQFTLSVLSGAVGERDDPGERCPNDGSPLWRVTWQQRAVEHHERAIEEMRRAEAAEAEVIRLRNAK